MHGGNDDDGNQDDRVCRTVEPEAFFFADLVRALPDALEQSWQKLRSEYRVQASIWDSLAQLRCGMAGNNGNSDPFAQMPMTKALRSHMEALLEQASGDPIEAIEGLEEILGNDDFLTFLSHAIIDALHGVLKGEMISSKRQQLVDHLEEDMDETPLDSSELEELETLLLECELDCKLEYRVRQVFRLGLRSALHHAALPEDNLDKQDFTSSGTYTAISTVFKKKVRFDLAEYNDDDLQTDAKRYTDDTVFVPSGGILSM